MKTIPTFIVQQVVKGNRRIKPLWFAHIMRNGKLIATGSGKDANAAIKSVKRKR